MGIRKATMPYFAFLGLTGGHYHRAGAQYRVVYSHACSWDNCSVGLSFAERSSLLNSTFSIYHSLADGFADEV